MTIDKKKPDKSGKEAQKVKGDHDDPAMKDKKNKGTDRDKPTGDKGPETPPCPDTRKDRPPFDGM